MRFSRLLDYRGSVSVAEVAATREASRKGTVPARELPALRSAGASWSVSTRYLDEDPGVHRGEARSRSDGAHKGRLPLGSVSHEKRLVHGGDVEQVAEVLLHRPPELLLKGLRIQIDQESIEALRETQRPVGHVESCRRR